MPAEPEQAQQSQGQSPAAPDQGEAWEGARLLTVSPALAEKFRLPADAAGVIVIAVEPGGLADQMGLRPGDLVSSVNRRKVNDVRDFQQTMKKADLAKGVVLDVNRQGQWIFLTYRKPQ
jgi:serine protease Do